MKDEKNPEAKLRFENDLLRLKLIAEFGMDFKLEKSAGLDPDIENQWLNHVYEFERLHSTHKKIPLREFIGSPVFKPADECDEVSIKKGLNNLTELLNENNINLSCICDYDDRVIYKFITEELFNYEIEDMRLKGWVTEFIYEEFHPNHDYDLRKQAQDFLYALFRRKWDTFDEIMLCEILTYDRNENIPRDKFITRINEFQDNWNEIRKVDYKVIFSRFDLETGTGYVNLKLSYTAHTETGKSIYMSGVAIIGFKLIGDYWNIFQVSIPGFTH